MLTEICLRTFATHGILQKFITDNRPPFNSKEFKAFLKWYDIQPVNSSPYHPRSNGMAERAVKEAKTLMRRCKGTEELLYGLLEWRNTPRDTVLDTSVRRLWDNRLGHFCRPILSNTNYNWCLSGDGQPKQCTRLRYGHHHHPPKPSRKSALMTSYLV